MYGERSAMSERYQYASPPEKLLIRCLLVKRLELKSSQIQLCCREHLILILSFVVTLRVYRVKILSCDIKSSQIHTFLCVIWHTSTSWRTANTSSLNKSFSYSIAKKHVWIWLSVLHLTVSHCQNSSTCTSEICISSLIAFFPSFPFAAIWPANNYLLHLIVICVNNFLRISLISYYLL